MTVELTILPNSYCAISSQCWERTNQYIQVILTYVVDIDARIARHGLLAAASTQAISRTARRAVRHFYSFIDLPCAGEPVS